MIGFKTTREIITGGRKLGVDSSDDYLLCFAAACLR